MGQYNDCMASALIAQGYNSAAVQDMLYDYLLDNGGLAGNINDLWHQVWTAQSVAAGTFDDRAYTWLGTLGFTGALSDRWLAFWCDGGIIGLITNLVTNSKLCAATDAGPPTGWTKSAHGDDGIALFERNNGRSSWLVSRDGSGGTATLAQTISSLGAGDYVASFRVDRVFTVTDAYIVGVITGANVTVSVAFPLTSALGTPQWVSSIFNNSVPGDVVFTIQAIAAGAAFEGLVASRPQLIAATEFSVADWTGTDCTGSDKSMLVDSNGEVVKDSGGNYLYVPI